MEDEARFAAATDPAPERAALPPRTGRRHRPGVRARPPSEASPLRDSAGITPASLGTAPPGTGAPRLREAYRSAESGVREDRATRRRARRGCCWRRVAAGQSGTLAEQ